jgi:hypothetical protein
MSRQHLRKKEGFPRKKFKNYFFNRNKRLSALHQAHYTITNGMVPFP